MCYVSSVLRVHGWGVVLVDAVLGNSRAIYAVQMCKRAMQPAMSKQCEQEELRALLELSTYMKPHM